MYREDPAGSVTLLENPHFIPLPDVVARLDTDATTDLPEQP